MLPEENNSLKKNRLKKADKEYKKKLWTALRRLGIGLCDHVMTLVTHFRRLIALESGSLGCSPSTEAANATHTHTRCSLTSSLLFYSGDEIQL